VESRRLLLWLDEELGYALGSGRRADEGLG